MTWRIFKRFVAPVINPKLNRNHERRNDMDMIVEVRQALADFEGGYANEGKPLSECFQHAVCTMEAIGFTFVKRETEVGFIKLIDKQGDGNVYEPHVIEVFEDIPQPRQWCNWAMASHKAAMRALEQYAEHLKGGGDEI